MLHAQANLAVLSIACATGADAAAQLQASTMYHPAYASQDLEVEASFEIVNFALY